MRAIDVNYLGNDRVISAWQVDDLLIDPGPESALERLLDELGEWRPKALLLTHIHLDHAGAAGTLARHWPEVEVYVHERGARHIVDPSRLLASATRLYGESEMARLWGEIVPIEQERVHPLAGGERLPLAGGITVAATPGHASHHLSYLHEESGRAFVGDTGGIRIPPADHVIAPTPPPDIDVEAWERSLDLIASWRPTSLGLTHFGAVDDADAQLEATRRSLRELAARSRGGDGAAMEAAVRAAIAAATDPATARSYELAVPPAHLFAGLDRYWSKEAQR